MLILPPPRSPFAPNILHCIRFQSHVEAAMSKSFLVVGDAAVQSILQNQTRAEILSFQSALSKALVSVTTANENQYQPKPGVINRGQQKVLFRSFTSPSLVGTKTIVDPAPVAQPDGTTKKEGLHGVITLLNEKGNPLGVVNAEEVTGYRTSLQAVIPFVWRKYVNRVVLFGAGKQALWHLRLALGLRGKEVESITVVNRSVERAAELVEKVKEENEAKWQSAAKIEVFAVAEGDEAYDNKLAELLGSADVVFCTVPSRKVLFPMKSLLSGDRSKNPLITAIGSWQAEMIELDPELLVHTASKPDGLVIFDDLEEVLHATGEGIQSGLKETDILELGQVLDWRSEKPATQASLDRDALETKLAGGLIVYKSVGVGLTDLIVGHKILEMVGEKGLGTSVEDF
nr:uncharacterized protein [Verruciconidia persicina]